MSALTGTAIAMLIAGGVSAAGSVAAAKIGANAAKTAAGQEGTAAGAAGDYVKSATADSLAHITAANNGRQVAPTYGTTAPTIPGATVQPSSFGAAMTTQQAPPAMTGAPSVAPPPPAAPGVTPLGANIGQTATVLVQAPDGSQRRIPVALQARAVQAGGKVIG
jgi:hypothetical protein